MMLSVAYCSLARAVLFPPVEAPVKHWWPRDWPSQCTLLERQHDQLESLLDVLIHDHQIADSAIEQALQLSCRRLLWDLRLHLRLEERWLLQCHCLCAGHQEAHREVTIQTTATLMAIEHDRQGRLALLESVQQWFVAHRHGPDAMAYRLAAQSSDPT